MLAPVPNTDENEAWERNINTCSLRKFQSLDRQTSWQQSHQLTKPEDCQTQTLLGQVDASKRPVFPGLTGRNWVATRCFEAVDSQSWHKRKWFTVQTQHWLIFNAPVPNSDKYHDSHNNRLKENYIKTISLLRVANSVWTLVGCSVFNGHWVLFSVSKESLMWLSHSQFEVDITTILSTLTWVCLRHKSTSARLILTRAWRGESQHIRYNRDEVYRTEWLIQPSLNFVSQHVLTCISKHNPLWYWYFIIIPLVKQCLSSKYGLVGNFKAMTRSITVVTADGHLSVKNVSGSYIVVHRPTNTWGMSKSFPALRLIASWVDTDTGFSTRKGSGHQIGRQFVTAITNTDRRV